MIYALIALAVLVGAYFLFFRKGQANELPRPAPEARVPERRPIPNDAPAPRAEERHDDAVPPAPPPRRSEHPAAGTQPATQPSKGTQLAAAAVEHARDIGELRRGLAKARGQDGFFGRLRALFAGKKTLSADLTLQIEEVLLGSDVGTETTQLLLQRLKDRLSPNEFEDEEKVWDTLRAEAERIVSVGRTGPLELRATPTVILMVGVNGAGKTTTIGKLATKLRASNKKCLLAAGDTFRAAAVQQLVVWGDRTGSEVVRGKDGSDPGSVVFDAIKRAIETGTDVVLADTAGRLHTKSNLMSEMTKIAKTAEKASPGAPHEILLVIDATNGQNALAQAREFKEALPLTGIVLTKLDGTAKGGVVLGIAHSLELPVRFVGLGERPDDLHEFIASDFIEALLGREAVEQQ
jgi:fused signal recognition particle receptor